MYTLELILNILSPKRSELSDSYFEILQLEYDSRQIRHGESSLFFALLGLRDGHLFIKDAYEKGVRNFVVSTSEFDNSSFVDANFIWVEDTLVALQDLAAYHRSLFDMPIVGITGSNGKTIVKEWLFQLLSVDKNCYESPKSYNSQIGVALSLWELQQEHEVALIEAGISQPGEMSRLQKMIQPTIGVLTSIGVSHAQGFASKAAKLDEKLELFAEVHTIIAPFHAVKDKNRDSRFILWGEERSANIFIKHKVISQTQTELTLVIHEQLYELTIPFTDQASIENVMTCLAVMMVFGYNMTTIQERILTLVPLDMRLQLKRGKNNCSIIDDSYSNDIASLQVALNFLEQQNQHTNKVLILSDFVGVVWDEKLKAKLLRLLQTFQFKRIIFVGEHVREIAPFLDAEIISFVHSADLAASVAQLNFQDETILIKGARRFELEKVVKVLVHKSHDTVLEINLKSIEHNLAQYRRKLKPGVKLMTMVKAFSYGSGSFEVANILQFNKVDYLTVAFVDEGVELRQGGIQLPIMVLSPHEGTFEDVLRYRLEPEIYSMRILKAFLRFLEKQGAQNYPIHIKLDTGMHRLGFMPDEISDLLTLLGDTDRIVVKSVFSHLAGAGNAALDLFTDKQVNLFEDMVSRFNTSLPYPFLRHICNSNGIVHRPDDQLDMVRLGIGLYGVDMAPKDLELRTVSTLKTTITQIKSLGKHETVGYDRKGVLHRDSRIATVKIGYADGYNRRFGNGAGNMLINNQLVSTVGNICMDMCMLDVTDVEAKEGDEVLVFPDIKIAADQIGTIPYELLTGISARVKRIYYYE